MSALTFELKSKPDQRLDLSPLVPERLKGLKSKDIEELKTQPAEQKEIRALYQAIADVAKAANFKLA